MQNSLPYRFFSLYLLLIVQTIAVFAQDKLSGSASISSTGAAIYSVAIEAPKGVGDLKPSIGIAYNSQSGNGLVGFGCNITGLSAITRGMKTIAHDNSVKGVSYDNNCALYLDGKRLLLKSGTEGTDGCIYAPEGEPLTNVTLHNSLSTTYCWFEVDTNDGMVYEYGHNGGQQFVTNPSAIASWNITKTTNSMGQIITYQYNSDGLYLYPQTITYGGDNTVNFTYQDRPDSVFFTLRNQRGYIAKRLRSVTTKAGSSTYRTYTISYNTTLDDTTTKFSRLTNIHETGENVSGSHYLTAQWNSLPSYSESCQQSVVDIPASNNYQQYNNRYLLSGDLNNDGISDIIHLADLRNSTGNYYQANVYKSQVTNGTVSFQSQLPLLFSPNVNINGVLFQKARSCVVDINGDGKNDLVFPCITNETPSGTKSLYFEMCFSDESLSGFSSNYTYGPIFFAGDDMPFYYITDLKRDGHNEIVALEKQGSNGQYILHLLDYAGANTPAHTIPLSLQSAPKHLFLSDFNHDGLTDLMVVCDDGYRIFYNQGGTSLQNLFVNSSTLNTTLTNHDHLEQGDFNGDGILDFIWNDNNSSQLFFEIGNADGTFTCHQAYNLSFDVKNKNSDEGTWNCIVTDLDHDGKSDVVLNLACYNPIGIFQETYTFWLLSNGTSLIKKKESTSNRESDAKVGRIFAGDFKGNGYFEVANYGYNCYNGINANVDPTVNIYSCSSHSIANGKAIQFSDSNGRKVHFTYAPMTSDVVYTKGTGSSYPLLDVVAPLCVTSQVIESGGSPITTQTNYTYKELRAHLQGRGLLGFSEVTATESNSGKEVKTTVNTIDPTYFVPTKTTIATTQGGMTATTQTIMRLLSSYHSSSISLGNYILLPESKVERDIYHNDIITSNYYDSNYFYLTEQSIVDDNSIITQIKQYTYSQNKIAGAYRLLSEHFTQTHYDDSEPFEKETRYTYDNYGRVTSVTEFPEKSLQLVTSYQYDNYGNVTKKKYSGYGISDDAEINYQYSSNGKFLTQKSDAAQTIGYSLNTFGDVMTQTDLTDPSNPLTTVYNRNGFGILTAETRHTGESTAWTKTSTTEYGGCYKITESHNNGPDVTTWYDAFGNVLRTETTGVNNVVISTTNTYNAQGHLTAKTSVRGDLTITENNTYDSLEHLSATTSTDGTSVTYSYGDREITTTKNGQTSTKYYDLWGNVVQSDDPVSSVSYLYHSIGKPREVTSEGSTVVIGYDDYGNQTSLDDPDAGLTTYQYDALHRIISQTDARGYVTTFSYDGAGRMTQKTAGGSTTSYTYATSGNGAGQLASVQKGNCTISYTYDSKGRLSQETRSMTGEQTLTFGYTYNTNGRLATKTYPQNVTVRYAYDDRYNFVATAIGNKVISLTTTDNGLQTVRKMGGQLYFVGEAPMNATNPAVTYTAAYDNRGFLTSTALKRNDNSTLHSMTYNFESGTANLLQRTGMRSSAETFTYDALERLTQVSWGGVTQQAVTYGDNGNITNKTGLGNLYYSSSPQRPHAVIRADNTQGSMSSATLQAVYNAFGKVQSLSEGGYSLNFSYGPDEERWKTVLTNNGATIRTTLYADSYERITEDGQTRHFYYLDDGVIYVLNNGASNGTFYYAFTDHLGSVTRMYDDQGTMVFSAYYDAWGKQTVTTNTLNFHRGYTWHEMLPEFGLINMNGRLYDPILGRFHSPDNFVQMPDFSQSFNRYSYCLNNPLKYVDPDGEIAWWVVAAIAGGYMGGVATNQGELNPIHWDYSNPITYGGILIGGIAGGITGSALAGSTAWNISFSISNPYLSAGVTIGATAASGLKYGFHWTTAAGGEYNNVEKVVKKTVERAGQAFDNYVDQYRRHMEDIHTGLDVIGLIPGGDFADFANAGLYLLEGDFSNAGLSAVAMVPVIGDIATGGKLVNKGFSSYRKFKKAYGKAGDGMEWHHIVEQRSANISQFGAERIHNIDNIVALPTDVHRKISGHYSSIQPESEHMRVRDWLNGKSFEFQYDYGLQLLKKYGY